MLLIWIVECELAKLKQPLSHQSSPIDLSFDSSSIDLSFESSDGYELPELTDRREL